MHRLARLLTLGALALAACAAPTTDEESSSSAIRGGEDDEENGTDDMGPEGEEEEVTTAARRAPVGRATCPVRARISQGFHGRHDGVDLAAKRGTPIYAIAAGTVTASGTAQGYGQWIRIRHDDGSMTEYGHMYERLVSTGARVRAGQRIALVGSEGRSTGPHLHLRTYRTVRSTGPGRGMNPVDYLRARGVRLPCTPGDAEVAPAASELTVSVWQSANVRRSPSLSADVIGMVDEDTTYAATCWKKGDEVSSDGYVNDRWVKVTADGVMGYVSGIFLRGDETGDVATECP